MFRQARNEVNIVGILEENDIQNVTTKSKKTNADVEYLRGTITVLVNDMHIPVKVMCTRWTNDGKERKSYTSLSKFSQDATSIAACGNKENASRVQIKGEIDVSDFVGRDNNIAISKNVNAIYASIINPTEFVPKAEFTFEGFLKNVADVMDKDGIPVEPHKVRGEFVVPKWTKPDSPVMNVQCVDVVSDNPQVIAGMQTIWEPGQSYEISGILNFTKETVVSTSEAAFGAPITSEFTKKVTDFVVMGSSVAMPEATAWKFEEIKDAVQNHRAELEQEKTQPRPSRTEVPSPTARNFGF